MPRPRFRRRRFTFFRRLFKLIIFLAGLWLAGLFIFAGWVFSSSPPSPMPHADGIVALTGGDGRVSEALALLAAKDAPAMLISGAGRGTYLGDFTQDNAPAATQDAANITIGHNASTTHTNASETAFWVASHHIKSLIIVTADYHMPRALLEIHAAIPAVKLIPVPVRPPAMDNLLSAPTLKLLAAEYSKYLIIRAGLGNIAATLTQPGS
jgi:uncharacterized SAM-binding protein YcdF (DUF218 family)